MPVHTSTPIKRVALGDITSEKVNAAHHHTSFSVSKEDQSSRSHSVSKKSIPNPHSRLLLYISCTTAKRRLSSFAELPVDVQQSIASRLSIADLHRARIAGLGLVRGLKKPSLVDPETPSNLWQENFVHRIQLLQPLWQCWVNDSCPSFRRRRLTTTPLEFVTNVQRLSLPSATPKILTAVSELTKLIELDLSRGRTWRESRLDGLPNAIASCTRLRVLRLSRSSFKALPPCVLRLRRLRRLDLDFNTNLASLPADIGGRLKQLTTFNINGCEKVRKLPRSLLRTLEFNMEMHFALPLVNPRIKRGHSPLLLWKEYFEDGYLRRVLNTKDYPRLAQSVARLNNAGAEPAPG